MRSLPRVLGALRTYWMITLGAAVSLALVTAANLWAPLVLRQVIDSGITPGNLNQIVWGAAALVGVAVLRGVFSFLQGFWSEQASQGVAYELRNQLFEKIQNLSFSYHDQAQTGQLMTRITSDVEQVRTFISVGLLQSVSAVAMLVGSIALLFSISWQLTLIVLLTVPAMAAIVVSFMRIVRPLFSQVQQRVGVLNTTLQENLAGARVVQAFAREEHEAERYKAANAELLEVNIKALRGLANNFPFLFLIANLGTLAVIWIGGYQVIGKTLSIGELVAFNTYLSLLIMPIMMLGMIVAQLSRAEVSAERIFEILDLNNAIVDQPGAQPLPAVTGRVAFENVSFGYGKRAAKDRRPPTDDRRPTGELGGVAPANGQSSAGRSSVVGGQSADDGLILREVSFTAEPGMTVAIMGQTGAGKSTIINLIPRFYDPTSGQVTIDGHDVRTVTLASLRDQIGIVLQDTTLFSGTIRENIAYGRSDASQAQVEAAAQAAQAHGFITEFPEGYATVVGERGVGLSGGQRQRIAIARALLRDPRILILDDSTSAVDAETEYLIQQALDTLMHGRTAFVIAQRISTVRNADLILLLERGQIVASGTHEQLLANSALYGEIIDSQFGGVHEPEPEPSVAA